MAETGALTMEMIAVLAILGFTVFLFVSEIVRVDVAAILIMVLIGLTSLIPGYDGLISAEHLFDGFATNAVISIIAVMIIGAGLDKTGLMSLLAAKILKIGGTTEKRIIPLISSTVGFISSFMQNVGAAALFLPVVHRISVRTGLPMSRLLMPMGFCAILGGTVTMIGSSPLILLNDLILTSNRALPANVEKMQTFELFAVTPIGIALLATGILYFVIAGRFVLPAIPSEGTASRRDSTLEYLQKTYGLRGDLFEAVVPASSELVGKTVQELEQLSGWRLLLVGMKGGNKTLLSPARDVETIAGAELALIGSSDAIQELVDKYGLRLRRSLTTFAESLTPSKAGIAEIVIPPGSAHIGTSMSELRMRKTYGTTVLAVHRGGETLSTGLRDLQFQAGDTLIAHITWEDLGRLAKDRNFVVVTTGYPHEELRPHKVSWAVLFFAIALTLVLFTDLRLSIALLVGAMGMVVSGVLTIDEAYRSVSWQTVFLLASLIPLGLAVEETGTAAWVARQTLEIVGDVPTWVLQAVIAVLATGFTLVMSNVGATVLLVPLAVNIALGAGADPALFALTVALATSNSFLIPTHQVNALIMGPAGYRVADFMRAGGVMTVLFLIVMIAMLNLVF
ncbi:MAG: SLC13 family permease [Proteobacteria bacterium]|nr:MAG: SLC13 family permease [Pseudomonadota bacterium]QKK11061.1 MAG: SLC13 family permease [Pseudomonadota bacterium]